MSHNLDRNAVERGVTAQGIDGDIVRYIIHGILHLLGYDDSRADFRRKMKRAENSLLRSVSKKFSFAQIARRR